MKDKKKAQTIADGVIAYLKNNKQEHLLEMVIEKLKSRSGMFHHVRVFVPTKLSSPQKLKVSEMVYKLVRSRTVKIDFIIDREIIDGLKIVSEDKVWDFSMSSQIEKIKNAKI